MLTRGAVAEKGCVGGATWPGTNAFRQAAVTRWNPFTRLVSDRCVTGCANDRQPPSAAGSLWATCAELAELTTAHACRAGHAFTSRAHNLSCETGLLAHGATAATPTLTLARTSHHPREFRH